MIPEPTVLILGAGASMNYGFPSGLQLKAKICKAIQEQEEIFEDLAEATNEKHVQDFYDYFPLSSSSPIIISWVEGYFSKNSRWAGGGLRDQAAR